jgi:hypothetical protein
MALNSPVALGGRETQPLSLGMARKFVHMVSEVPYLVPSASPSVKGACGLARTLKCGVLWDLVWEAPVLCIK